jgi:hypothetical protein
MNDETCPEYYKLPENIAVAHDLTDLFVLRYGHEAVMLHLLMELEQYAWRCRDKGTFSSDLKKITDIGDRLCALEKTHGALMLLGIGQAPHVEDNPELCAGYRVYRSQWEGRAEEIDHAPSLGDFPEESYAERGERRRMHE